jgi:hypothetical protein
MKTALPCASLSLPAAAPLNLALNAVLPIGAAPAVPMLASNKTKTNIVENLAFFMLKTS